MWKVLKGLFLLIVYSVRDSTAKLEAEAIDWMATLPIVHTQFNINLVAWFKSTIAKVELSPHRLLDKAEVATD